MNYIRYAIPAVFLVLGFSSVCILAQVAEDSLIAHYSFDNNLKDEKGLSDGHFATGGASGVTYRLGFNGTENGALLFGAEDTTWYRVDLGQYSPSQSGAKNEMACAFWAYWNGSTGSWQDIINKRDDWSDDGMMWGINQHRATGHKLSVRLAGFEADSRAGIPEKKWTHVVITLSVDTVRFYIDGVKKDELKWRFGTKTAAEIHIGTSPNGQIDAYNGALDDLRFYSSILNDEQVSTLYTLLTKDLVDPVGIELSKPPEGTLARNFPNPFNSSTTIEYTLTGNTHTEIVVYDLTGQKIATLVNEYRNKGTYSVVWDASGLSSGVYIYLLRTDDIIWSGKMKLIR